MDEDEARLFSTTDGRDMNPVVPLKFAIRDSDRDKHIEATVRDTVDDNELTEVSDSSLLNLSYGEPDLRTTNFACKKSQFDMSYFFDAVNFLDERPIRIKESSTAPIEAKFDSVVKRLEDLEEFLAQKDLDESTKTLNVSREMEDD